MNFEYTRYDHQAFDTSVQVQKELVENVLWFASYDQKSSNWNCSNFKSSNVEYFGFNGKRVPQGSLCKKFHLNWSYISEVMIVQSCRAFLPKCRYTWLFI